MEMVLDVICIDVQKLKAANHTSFLEFNSLIMQKNRDNMKLTLRSPRVFIQPYSPWGGHFDPSFKTPLKPRKCCEYIIKVVQEKIDTLFKRHYIFDMAEYDCFIFLVIQVNDYFSISSM